MFNEGVIMCEGRWCDEKKTQVNAPDATFLCIPCIRKNRPLVYDDVHTDKDVEGAAPFHCDFCMALTKKELAKTQKLNCAESM